jgi:hypothetical protein
MIYNNYITKKKLKHFTYIARILNEIMFCVYYTLSFAFFIIFKNNFLFNLTYIARKKWIQ